MGGRPRFRGARTGSLNDALSEATSLTIGGLLPLDAFGGRPRFLGAGACRVRQLGLTDSDPSTSTLTMPLPR